MSRQFLGAVLSVAMVATVAVAADTSHVGLKQGDSIGAFYVTKIAGAVDDGVPQDQELCYRCKYGQRPMVMVFARKGSDKLNDLIVQLDKAVAENSDAQLKSFVTVVGADPAGLKKAANQICDQAKVKNIPFVVAADSENGPDNYRLDPKAEITVIVANESQVVSTYSFAADKIDAAAVLGKVKEIVN